MTGKSLKERFENFASTDADFENVDALMNQCSLIGRKCADYLALNRLAIIEQKYLDVDGEQKLEEFIRKIARERGIIVYGQGSVNRIFHGQPDEDDLLYRSRHLLDSRIDSIIKNADKQIRDTRKTFLNFEATGIVVILNESAQFLSPGLISERAHFMLNKRCADGSIRYKNCQVVWLISEAHRIKASGENNSIPMVAVFSDEAKRLKMPSILIGILTRKWGAYNSAGFIDSVEPLKDIHPSDQQKILKFST